MPLTSKGRKIMRAMQKSKSEGGYGKKKGEQVFYASANKGKIKGVHEDISKEDIEKYGTDEEKKILEGSFLSKLNAKTFRFGLKSKGQMEEIKKEAEKRFEEYSKHKPGFYIFYVNGREVPDWGAVFAKNGIDALEQTLRTNIPDADTLADITCDEFANPFAIETKLSMGSAKEDIEKYGTKEEKEFLKEMGDFENWAAYKPSTIGFKDYLRDPKIGIAGHSKGSTLTKPFGKGNKPTKYLKILLALDTTPGLTKKEIYYDILDRTDIDPDAIRGHDSVSLWGPLRRAGLIIHRRNPETGRIEYFLGPNWPKYKKDILGMEVTPADEGEAALAGEE